MRVRRMSHRDADGWPESRERLREVVNMRGAAEVASAIPCHRATLFRLLRGDVVPSLPTQACVDRFLDDQDLAGTVGGND